MTRIRPDMSRADVVSTAVAARLAGVHVRTVRRWCEEFEIGWRPVSGGPWRIWRPALLMAVAGDRAALRAFRDGARAGPLIEPYLASAG